MKLLSDVSGEELISILARYGYRVTRQTGSHIRLTTTSGGEHHITIPLHNPIKPGTLNNILGELAGHFKIPKQTVIQELFDKKQ